MSLTLLLFAQNNHIVLSTLYRPIKFPDFNLSVSVTQENMLHMTFERINTNTKLQCLLLKKRKKP